MHKRTSVVVLAVTVGPVTGTELGLVTGVASDVLELLTTVRKLTLVSVPFKEIKKGKRE